ACAILAVAPPSTRMKSLPAPAPSIARCRPASFPLPRTRWPTRGSPHHDGWIALDLVRRAAHRGGQLFERGERPAGFGKHLLQTVGRLLERSDGLRVEGRLQGLRDVL